MPDLEPRYCDVSLPVPVDRLFTYDLPLALRQHVRSGCRVRVPFGARKLTGVVFRTHCDPSTPEKREVLALLDQEPVLDRDLLQLGQWVAEYYCAPLGEVLKSMLPLSGEARQSGGSPARAQFPGFPAPSVPRSKALICPPPANRQ